MIPKPSHPNKRKKIDPEKIKRFIETTKESKIQMNRPENGSSSIYLWENIKTLPEIKVTTILNLTLILSKIKIIGNLDLDKSKRLNSIIIVLLSFNKL